MSSIYHTLAIFPTDRCNARCDICAIECGPEKKNHLPRELAEAAIRQAGEMENMKRLIISGGEPWLLRDEVLSYAGLATSLGLSVTLYSNGFWGTNANSARSAVQEMKAAGITAVSFSADRYHQAFVPAEHLQNSMEAVIEAGLSCELSVMDFADRGALPWVRKTFGEQLLREPVHFLLHPAAPAGRARETIPEKDFWRPFPANLAPCPHGGLIQLTPAGNWLPCCGMNCREIPPLVIGNARDMELRKVEGRAMDNEVLKIILLEGWGWFCRKAKEAGYPFPKNVSLPCECCWFLFNHPDFVERIREEVRHHVAELTLIRALGV